MNRIKSIIFFFLFFTLGFFAGYFLSVRLNTSSYENVLINKLASKPLNKYTIDNLSSSKFLMGSFSITSTLEKQESYTAYKFSYTFVPDPKSTDTKVTSGLINIPNSNEQNKYPLVVLIRGYVDQNNYTTGEGTMNIGRYLTSNGFVTVAPDFLGYGDSDHESSNIFESRFQTYVTAVSLVKSIEAGMLNKYWDGKNLFIWGHSNGGQITLTTLEITGGNYPTVLWAPVSKPFPYSVLYYTDESNDHGKLIRRELSKFESLYDVENFSLTNYFNNINAPIQLHQGTADDAVPLSWSNSLNDQLKNFVSRVWLGS